MQSLNGHPLGVLRQYVGEQLAPLRDDHAVAADAVEETGGVEVVLILYAVEVKVIDGIVGAPVFVDDGKGRAVDERQAFGYKRADQSAG